MKNFYISFFAILLLFQCKITFAQDQTKPEPESDFYIGGIMSMGFFDPGDVNQDIKNKLDGATINQGVSDIFVNYTGSLTAGYKINRFFGLQAIGDIALAPKFITIQYPSGTETQSYLFWRVSPGITANFTLPVATNGSIFLGLGGAFHIIGFDGYTGTTVGYKLSLGYNLYYEDFSYKPFIAFDYANANTGNYNVQKLNYTDFRCGIEFFYNLK